MTIYNVTVKVDAGIAAEWVKWMTTVHQPELMELGIFTGCRLFRLLEQDESEGPTYVAQYFCDSMADYNTYIEQHAPIMREKTMALFAGKFAAFRTIMEQV